MHNGVQSAKLRILNPNKEMIAPTSDFASTSTLEPSNVMQHPSSTNLDDLSSVLEENDLPKIWHKPKSDFTDDE